MKTKKLVKRVRYLHREVGLLRRQMFILNDSIVEVLNLLNGAPPIEKPASLEERERTPGPINFGAPKPFIRDAE